jgi:hypothetical protein
MLQRIAINLPRSGHRQLNVFLSASNGYFIETYQLEKANGKWFRGIEIKKPAGNDYNIVLQCEDPEYPVSNRKRFEACR